MQPLTLTWAGGEHNFHLPLQALQAVQQRCDAGPEWILERLSSKRWHVEDVTETIRLGLQYGGLSPAEARRVLNNALENHPLLALVVTAAAVIAAAISRGKEDKVGESQAGADGQRPDPLLSEENGTSQTSSNGPTSSTSISGG